jgi:hypothetical protein
MNVFLKNLRAKIDVVVLCFEIGYIDFRCTFFLIIFETTVYIQNVSHVLKYDTTLGRRLSQIPLDNRKLAYRVNSLYINRFKFFFYI